MSKRKTSAATDRNLQQKKHIKQDSDAVAESLKKEVQQLQQEKEKHRQEKELLKLQMQHMKAEADRATQAALYNPFDILPTHVTKRILECSSLKSRVNLRGVCKEFHTLLAESHIDFKWANAVMSYRQRYNEDTGEHEDVVWKLGDRPDDPYSITYMLENESHWICEAPLSTVAPLLKRIIPLTKADNLDLRYIYIYLVFFLIANKITILFINN